MRTVLLGLAMSVAACADATAPTRGGDLLAARAAQGVVELANRTNQPVYYLVVDSDFLALANLALCTDPETCPSVGPRGRAAVPFAAIEGYEAGGRRSATVLHWRLIPAVGRTGYVPDSVRAVTLRLR